MVRRQAEHRRLNVIDATCPLVTKVHLEAVKAARSQGTILLIGHRDGQGREDTARQASRYDATQRCSGPQ
jgi:4-hydroxy-3-methylbut-2-enyl diphosphate reductase